jgi:hypothetical protein
LTPVDHKVQATCKRWFSEKGFQAVGIDPAASFISENTSSDLVIVFMPTFLVNTIALGSSGFDWVRLHCKMQAMSHCC